LERHATEIGERKKILTAGKQNQGLRDRDEPKLTNLGKRMNSINFTLWQDAARKTALGGLVLQRWRARKQIKGRGKNRRGLSKAGAADRECNVEHMQAAADSNGREKLARLPGLGNREKKREKEKGNGSWAGGLNWARVELNAKTDGVSAS